MKKVLITGGTRGIGAAMARRFHTQGCDVRVTYAHNEEAARAFSKETGIQAVQWDVSDFNAMRQQTESMASTWGGPAILICNAGITRDVTLRKMTPEMWHEVIDTNLSAVFYLCQWALPAMKENGWGRILTLSSINAETGMRGQTNYTASKAGLLGFTKSLAREVAREGITVNALAPGYTETDMVAAVPEDIQASLKKQIPLQRFVKPDEIAAAAVFLASDEAAAITGHTLHINGGHWMG